MAANISPIFTLTPVIGITSISTANPGRDGTGILGTVLTGGADGTRINRIVVQARGPTTAGMIRLYIGDNAGIPNIFMWREVIVTAIVASATVAAFISIINLTGESALVLPNGFTLRASTVISEAFNVFAEGGNY
ncbi:MAG TPA: hypothetical protein VLH56_05245 [Dissulfurispiraceae bacterium]|nr:hypothetical protein [Dissulfurispiraceae bacterium]